jgi:rhamnogalacturonyl hydrolase YesR
MSNSANSMTILTALQNVQTWVEEHNYRGYEPFDGLCSYLRPLAFGSRFGEQLLQQLGRQSPINLRPILGIKPQDSTKGRGYMAWGYLHRFAANGNEEDRSKAEQCLDWLDLNKSRKYAKHSWGNVFDYVSRAGRINRDEPTIVWTGLIAQAYLEAFEQTRNRRWLQIADSICSWILDLPREQTATGTCLAYDFHQYAFVHNSNLLGAAALARTAKHTGNREYLQVARSAVEYSCHRQLADGAWYYAEEPKYHWIDNFHTGYNLDSLKRYIHYTGDNEWCENLSRGFAYFKKHFIDPDGCPRYYHNRRQPIDIQGAAQVIDTLTLFSDEDPESLELAGQVARWTIKNMQGRDGHFYYRLYPLITVRAPMIHWGQATMFKALAHLSLKLKAAGMPALGLTGKNSSHSGSTVRDHHLSPVNAAR